MSLNRLKGFFVSAFLTLESVAAAQAAQALWKGFSLAWLGTLIIAGAWWLWAAYTFGGRRTRTARQMPSVLMAGGLGLAISIAGAIQSPDAATLPLAYSALLAAICQPLYVFWYSKLERGASTLTTGEPLPDFELQTPEGASITSAEIATRPTVWLFFRGNWCPLCTAQIKEVAGQYREIEARGAQVVLVSSQPHDNTISLSKRFDAPMRFMVDEGLRAARALGIVHTDGTPAGLEFIGYDRDTALPTVFISDADGRVVWKHETDLYRVRPEPETFLQVLGTLG